MTTNNVVGNPTGVALIRTARYFPLKATCSSTSNGEEKTCVSDSGTCQTSLVPSLPFARDSTIFREGTLLDVHAKIEDYSDSWSFDREPPRVRPSFSRRDDDEPRSITSFRREKCKEIGEGKVARKVCVSSVESKGEKVGRSSGRKKKGRGLTREAGRRLDRCWGVRRCRRGNVCAATSVPTNDGEENKTDGKRSEERRREETRRKGKRKEAKREERKRSSRRKGIGRGSLGGRKKETLLRNLGVEKRGEGSVLSLKRDRLFRGGARAVASRGLYLSVEGYWFSNSSVPYPPRPSEREGNDESSLPLARSLAGRRSFARSLLAVLACTY